MEFKKDLDKLTMLDEHGHKKRIYAADVQGFFRTYRNWTQAILVLIFMILPWTKMNGVQTVLIDMPHRKFAIFGLMFFAHDVPLIFFIFAIAVFSLALSTAVLGRVWCGWACPQTVFIDGVFRRIERLIEGSHLTSRELDRAPMSFKKVFKKTLKWSIYIFVSSIIAHSFIAYFTGAEELLKMTSGNPLNNWTPFIFVTVITAIIAFDFGWFREQFCIIVCPYGRFQSVLQDKQTVTVMYDDKRGEPRKGSAEYGEKKGDCIACSRCIQVCPTGIDIRDGAQMECIACTACIDACDEIMEKVHKPKGLIRYGSLDGGKGKFVRTRSIAYAIIILAAISGLSYNIMTRTPLEIFILRGKEAPYQLSQSADGQPTVINHMRLHLRNQTFEIKDIKISALPEWTEKGIQMTTPEPIVKLAPGEFKMVHFFVTSPKELFKGSGEIKTLIDIDGVKKEFKLVGPTGL